MPKRVSRLFKKFISDANLRKSIIEVNASHHWHDNHTPNRCTAWVEETADERIEDLRRFIIEGFIPHEPRVMLRYDAAAGKWRHIFEPQQWPDQYIHHALIQVLQPVMMRGMDYYCCGSIRKRGTSRARSAMQDWIRNDIANTKYEFEADVYHFYDSLKPEVVMQRMKQLVKDHQILDVIWRIIKDGVKIGYYTSQWFANTVLQPLDQLIRQSHLCKHYMRYMDNLSIFGGNKRKLWKLKELVVNWLQEHDLQLKGDWQIFPIERHPEKPAPLEEPRRGVERSKRRLPKAVGYIYGRNFTIPRKHNFYMTKRHTERYRKRRDEGLPTTRRQASGLLSRIGQLRHSNNRNLYQYLYRGERIERELKNIVREEQRKDNLTWNMYLELRAMQRSSKQRERSTAA